MKILFIGDIMGNEGVSIVQRHLKSIVKLNAIDFVFANGENAHNGKGINRDIANRLFDAGVDIISMGNHTFNNYDILKLFDDEYKIIRPLNLPYDTPGDGYIIMEKNGINVCVINLMGMLFMNHTDNPFNTMDRVLDKISDKSKIIIVDFHAEATSEKMALGRYLDGRVTAVLGTHTHVVTADEQILPKNTAYITDVGMTGSHNGVIGAATEAGLHSFTSAIPERLRLAEGNVKMNTVIISVNENTGKAEKIERLCIE